MAYITNDYKPVKYREGNFPPKNIDWERLVLPLSEAVEALARYDSFLGILPDPDLMLSPLLLPEAVASSRIEGTRTTLSEVLTYEADNDDIDPSKIDDVQEVINYRSAVLKAIQLLETLPLSGRVLRAAHEVLLQGVRGQFKSPGKYRLDQCFIGSSYNIEEARYIPPAPDDVPNDMARWERFIHDESYPTLVKIAIAHAEFEAIHPFDDGNGRVGRMAIPLMLYTDGLMSNPCFYMSEFFEHRNTEYQDRLWAIFADNDWTGWTEFFLKAMKIQASENHQKAHDIFDFYNEVRTKLRDASHSLASDAIVDKLFQAPIFRANDFAQIDGINIQTSRRLLRVLQELGIVRTIRERQGRKSALMVVPRLLTITEGMDLT